MVAGGRGKGSRDGGREVSAKGTNKNWVGAGRWKEELLAEDLCPESGKMSCLVGTPPRWLWVDIQLSPKEVS